MKKCIVMLSGGLDSRLAVKIMQEQGFDVLALFFNLPFLSNYDKKYLKMKNIKLKVFDCTKGKLLQEYLKVIKEAKHGTGVGVNPCIDCRIFMLKKAKEFADKEGVDLIVTGEVLGERPMSQMKKAMGIIDKETGLDGRILRPLSAKLLEKTDAEEKGLVDRNKLYDIKGRNRKRQMTMAKEFGISYPHPAGGCLLCEKYLKKRFEKLLERGLNDEEIKLVGVGRHFIINGNWIVLGRDENESKFIENFEGVIVPDFIGPSAVIPALPPKDEKKLNEKVNNLIKAYSKLGSLEDRKKFERFKL